MTNRDSTIKPKVMYNASSKMLIELFGEDRGLLDKSKRDGGIVEKFVDWLLNNKIYYDCVRIWQGYFIDYVPAEDFPKIEEWLKEQEIEKEL